MNGAGVLAESFVALFLCATWQSRCPDRVIEHVRVREERPVFSIYTRIRRARSLAGLTQTEVARRVGVQRSAVTQWERKGGTTPSVCHLAQIACETQVCFEWLATGRGPCNPEAGEFDSAVIVEDFARDELESRVLQGLRRVPDRKREALVQVVELLSA